MSLLSRLAVQAARAYGILSSADKTKVVADYLVVAGGGGGGSNGGAGGGAGGYQTSTATLSTLNTYSIAVGSGGSGGVTAGAAGGSGTNSSLSGTGLSTVTSIGGGGGGKANVNGASGGSGGGAGQSSSTAGSGTSGQGYAGGANSSNSAGGGGGAGSVGSAASGNTGGNGGSGVSSSISGSSVGYAGGGGGSGGSTGGSASDGGGAGGGAGAAGTAGTANTGGGGGGQWNTGANVGGAGGSGIVIISYTSATPKFVGGTITTSGGKQIHTFTSSGTLSPITPITASYLVVAGGGSGGSRIGGGGGAGGLLTGSTTLYSGASYVVTVGAGGASVTSTPGTNGNQGSSSSLAGTGLTTITSTGGGYGGAYITSTGQNGGNGGSGGGAAGFNGGLTGGSGTSGQGFAGGNAVSSGEAGGGGGGSSAVGSNGGSGSGGVGGAGGAGTASSITGTSVTYAGGGGGSGTGGGGAGGSGGGGAGSASTTNATPGTANTGGGGGGARNTTDAAGVVSGAGGSGIVIISYAGSQAFNGGLVTTSGGNTIHTFTSTGALTPLTNNLNNSLRFRSSASAYLSRTPTVAGNQKTWTWSGWVKRGTLGVNAIFFQGYDGSSSRQAQFGFNTSDQFVMNQGGDASSAIGTTTAVFRDPSAWYHFVLVANYNSSSFSLYVNGNQQSITYSTSVSNQNGQINGAWLHRIGSQISTNYFDGYLADVNFIDGQALEPYYFGNNDANGVWKPILYKGTYGTNGFYLTFGNTTSTTTLGYDSSPNGNNWTCNNISLTAGTTYDAMTDVPTNTSATVANYAVLNPLAKTVGSNTAAPSEANLKIPFNNNGQIISTMAMDSGKWYAEFSFVAGTLGTDTRIGIQLMTEYPSAYAGNSAGGYVYMSTGEKQNNSSQVAYGSSWTTNDIIGVAFDATAGTITFYKNNVSQGTAYSSITAGSYGFVISQGNSTLSKTFVANFGQRPFTYTPPTGYVALNTYNLPTPTILQGNKYMDATLYTGNNSTQVIVNQAQFKPDFVWIKSRSVSGNHSLFNSISGANKVLSSSLTMAEETPTAGTGLLSFNSNGFTLGADITGVTGGETNGNGFTLVGWQWQAGQGSTSSNTSGSITSTVSVNTTAGFSIATYTGNGSAGATIGHGLGVAPKFIIIKKRSSTADWDVYHSSLGATKALYLNRTDGQQTGTTFWNDTAPSSTLTTFGTSPDINSNGVTYVMYSWAEIAGFSKFTSYTGNGSTDGPFIFLGFRPKFVMIKRTDGGTNNWVIFDSSRNTYNATGKELKANTTAAEYDGDTTNPNDFLSNGLKIRHDGTAMNILNGTYIVAAWAEHPFKNSNAR